MTVKFEINFNTVYTIKDFVNKDNNAFLANTDEVLVSKIENGITFNL